MTIEELQAKIAELTKELEALLASEEEGDLERAEDKEKEIVDAERKLTLAVNVEKRNKEIVKTNLRKAGTSEEEKVAKRFDLFKALREGSNATGLEKEMREEAIKESRNAGININDSATLVPEILLKRAAFDSTAGANLTHKDLSDDLKVRNTLLVSDKLGISRYEGLNGNFEVPSMSEMVATFIDEGDTASDASITPSKLTLTPKFVQVSTPFSKQFLHQTSQQLQNKVLAQFDLAIQKRIEQKVFDEIYAIAALTGYASGDTFATGSTAAFAAILAQEADIEYGDAYLVSNKVRAYMKNKSVDGGSGSMIWTNDTVNGYNAYASSMIDDNGVIFGSFGDAALGLWGGMEIVVDEITLKKKGQIEVQYSRFADAGVSNSASFSVIKNYPIA